MGNSIIDQFRRDVEQTKDWDIYPTLQSVAQSWVDGECFGEYRRMEFDEKTIDLAEKVVTRLASFPNAL